MSTYQEMSNQLDSLIAQLQSGELDVDDAIKKYEQASKLIAKMEAYLQTAENKIEKIKASFTTA